MFDINKVANDIQEIRKTIYNTGNVSRETLPVTALFRIEPIKNGANTYIMLSLGFCKLYICIGVTQC